MISYANAAEKEIFLTLKVAFENATDLEYIEKIYDRIGYNSQAYKSYIVIYPIECLEEYPIGGETSDIGYGIPLHLTMKIGILGVTHAGEDESYKSILKLDEDIKNALDKDNDVQSLSDTGVLNVVTQRFIFDEYPKLKTSLILTVKRTVDRSIVTDWSQYDQRFVLKAGDTMQGLLTLFADPTNPLHAATKQYVDNEIDAIDTLSAAILNFDSLIINFGKNTGDITLNFLGDTHDGVLKWWEDEDYFEFQDDILMEQSEAIFFRNINSYIRDNGANIEIVDDVEIGIEAPLIDVEGAMEVSGTIISEVAGSKFGASRAYFELTELDAGAAGYYPYLKGYSTGAAGDNIIALDSQISIIGGDGTTLPQSKIAFYDNDNGEFNSLTFDGALQSLATIAALKLDLNGGELNAGDIVASGNIEGFPTAVTWSFPGTLYVSTAEPEGIYTMVMDDDYTIVKVKAYVQTAPTGADLIIDVDKNGTTIFTTQANRPIIAAGNNADDSGTPNVTSLAEGDRLGFHIDQVGSTVAGADLSVTVVLRRA